MFYLWLWKTYRTAQSCGSERRILRLFYYSAFSSERCDHVLISPGETGGDYRGSGGIVGDGNLLGMIWCFDMFWGHLIPIRYKKYNVADSCHCEGVRPEAIFHQ